MTPHDAIQLFAKTLENLEKWMDKAEEQAKARSFDVDVLADARKVSPSWLGGRWLRGSDYLVQMAVPNFFFHATLAYAILRHNGVVLGKMDFIGSFPTQEG